MCNKDISNPKAIILDIFVLAKYEIVLVGALKFFSEYKYSKNVLNLQRKIIAIFCCVGIICMIINQQKGIPTMNFPEQRYGLKSFQFIAGHPGDLGVICNYLIMFLVLDLYINPHKKKIDSILIMLDLILMISTLRTRAICNAILFSLLYYCFYYKRNSKRNIKIILFITVILISFVSIDQFQNYCVDSGRTPRSDLLKGGIKLMQENSPIGAGLGNYGSFAAKKYYSQIYYRFGFNNNYGMSKDEGMFLTDNFWPMIMGEFGYIGIILYINLLIGTFCLLKHFSISWKNKLMIYYIFIAMLLNSTASSAFVHYSSVSYMFILSYFIFFEGREKKEDGKR